VSSNLTEGTAFPQVRALLALWSGAFYVETRVEYA